MALVCPLCHRPTVFGSFGSLQLHFDTCHGRRSADATKSSTAVQDLESRIDSALSRQLTRKGNTNVFDRWTAYSSLALLQQPMQPTVDLVKFKRADRDNQYLRDRCFQLEDILAQRQLDFDAILLEQDALKRRFDSLADFLRHQAASQTRGRMQLAAFIDKLVDEVEISKRSAEEVVEQPLAITDGKQVTKYTTEKPPTPADSGYHESPFYTRMPTPARLSDRFDTMSVDHSRSTKRQPTVNYVPLPTSGAFSVPTDQLTIVPTDQQTLRYSVPTDQQTDATLFNDQPSKKLWKLVFERLDPVDLLLCMGVCRSWKSIASHSSLWIVVRLQNRAISTKTLSLMAKFSTEMKALTLIELKLLSRDYNDPVKPGCCEPGLEAMLKASSKNLEFLKIAQCGMLLTDRSLWIAGCQNPKLQTVIFLSDRFALTSGVAWALGCGCRRLQTMVVPALNVQRSSAKDHRLLTVVAKCWPATMRALAVGGRFVTIEGLIDIAKGCVNLEQLELNDVNCIGETQAKILCQTGFRSLRYLTMDGCKLSADTIIVFYDKLPKLEKMAVTFYFTQADEQIGKDMVRLEALRRRHGHQKLAIRLVDDRATSNIKLR